jgi:hypothetical protein
MQRALEVALAWTLKRRQLHDMKIKMLVDPFTFSVMVQYAEYCGLALA